MKIKETFNRRKVHKEIFEFKIGKLMWFSIHRQIPDIKFIKPIGQGLSGKMPYYIIAFSQCHTMLTKYKVSLIVYTLKFEVALWRAAGVKSFYGVAFSLKFLQ